MTVIPAGTGAGTHSGSLGVVPDMPGQSLLPEMPHHELPEGVIGPVPAGVRDTINVLFGILQFA